MCCLFVDGWVVKLVYESRGGSFNFQHPKFIFQYSFVGLIISDPIKYSQMMALVFAGPQVH